MESDRDNLDKFLGTFDNPFKIAIDKGLAKIGDNLVNLCYSLAQFLSYSKIGGKKVPNKALAHALRRSVLRRFAGRRRDAHGLADAVEAIIGYCWLKGLISLEGIVHVLTASLRGCLHENKTDEDTSTAFMKLLDDLNPLFSSQFNHKESLKDG